MAKIKHRTRLSVIDQWLLRLSKARLGLTISIAKLASMRLRQDAAITKCRAW